MKGMTGPSPVCMVAQTNDLDWPQLEQILALWGSWLILDSLGERLAPLPVKFLALAVFIECADQGQPLGRDLVADHLAVGVERWPIGPILTDRADHVRDVLDAKPAAEPAKTLPAAIGRACFGVGEVLESIRRPVG